jgi:hypothetical protein
MFQKLQRNIDYYFQIQTPKDQVRFKSSLQYFVWRMCIYQKFVPGKHGFTSDFKVEAIAMISPKLSGITIFLKAPLRQG